ncbi:MAG: FAD-dependent oxidoreductase [Roseovarius sp.]
MKVDTVIVGAGSAGLSAFREVRRDTQDFLLVNDSHWGTTCAAVGCMPSKALIEGANAFHRRGAFESSVSAAGRACARTSPRSSHGCARYATTS